MKNWQGILVAVAVLVMSTMATAQVIPPQIGIFFDAAGTQTEAPLAGAGDFVTAYVMTTGGQMLMGGVSFAVEAYPGIQIVAASPMSDAVVVGNDITAGVEIGFYDAAWVDDNNHVVLYTLVLTVDDRPMGNMPLTVVNHPNYQNVVVAQSDGALYDTTGLTAYITPPPPVVGVYFDTAATITSATYNGGLGEVYPAYIFATGGPILMGGASFKLELDPNITLLTATAEPSVTIGDVLTGIEIGLYDAKFVDPQHPGLLMTLLLTTMNNLVDNAPLTITNHPSYETVLLADAEGVLVPSEGMTSYLTVPVANEDRSWSDVKSLYK